LADGVALVPGFGLAAPLDAVGAVWATPSAARRRPAIAVPERSAKVDMVFERGRITSNLAMVVFAGRPRK
jgi:hypothetical protein